MKVCKFGGSSLADAKQMRKVWSIIQSDPERRIIVVSAPGRRDSNDFKVTDKLIALANAINSHYEARQLIEGIAERYETIARDLGITEDFGGFVMADLDERIDRWKHNPSALTNALKAAGEDLCAQLVAMYFENQGSKCTYLSPKDIGLFLESKVSGASLIKGSYKRIGSQLREALAHNDLVVIPGFFGYSEDGEQIYTFSRGGSDISGSIVAASVDAELYENWTDVDAVYAISPGIYPQAYPIRELTYHEMRELAYAGFSVIHEEALEPLMAKEIPLKILNTNNPSARGSIVLPERTDFDNIVTGVAGTRGFVAIRIAQYLMNREIGYIKRILDIFERYHIPIEHMPTGIDSMTLIIRDYYFPQEKAELVLRDLRNELKPDEIDVERDLAIVMIVGDAMAQTVGVAKRAVTALADAGINIDLMIQESSEISIIFGVQAHFCTYAVLELYKAFFR